MEIRSINCQVLTVIDNEEVFVGHANVYHIPRKGDYIWFSEKRLGHSSWIVEDVAHHVGNGEFGTYIGGYQSAVLYVVSTQEYAEGAN